MRRTFRTPILALALSAALTACSSGTDGPTAAMLQEDLDAQAAAQASLRDRISELEDRLDVRAEADSSGVAALDDRIGELSTQLGDLTTQLERELSARDDADAETQASIEALRAEIAGVKDSLDELRTEVTKLREEHELLKRRFENHDH